MMTATERELLALLAVIASATQPAAEPPISALVKQIEDETRREEYMAGFANED